MQLLTQTGAAWRNLAQLDPNRRSLAQLGTTRHNFRTFGAKPGATRQDPHNMAQLGATRRTLVQLGADRRAAKFGHVLLRPL